MGRGGVAKDGLCLLGFECPGMCQPHVWSTTRLRNAS